MEVDFDELQETLKKMKPYRKATTYDWPAVKEWMKKTKFVTQRLVAAKAGVKHMQQAQQWLNRKSNLWMVINMITKEKCTVNKDGFIVKLIQGRNVVYAHRSHFEKATAK